MAQQDFVGVWIRTAENGLVREKEDMSIVQKTVS